MAVKTEDHHDAHEESEETTRDDEVSRGTDNAETHEDCVEKHHFGEVLDYLACNRLQALFFPLAVVFLLFSSHILQLQSIFDFLAAARLSRRLISLLSCHLSFNIGILDTSLFLRDGLTTTFVLFFVSASLRLLASNGILSSSLFRVFLFIRVSRRSEIVIMRQTYLSAYSDSY